MKILLGDFTNLESGLPFGSDVHFNIWIDIKTELVYVHDYLRSSFGGRTVISIKNEIIQTIKKYGINGKLQTLNGVDVFEYPLVVRPTFKLLISKEDLFALRLRSMIIEQYLYIE